MTGWIIFAGLVAGVVWAFRLSTTVPPCVEYRVKKDPGDSFYSYWATCQKHGWEALGYHYTGMGVLGGVTMAGTRGAIRRAHDRRDGKVISFTSPCPVCGEPSLLGDYLCGKLSCAQAIAEVSKIKEAGL